MYQPSEMVKLNVTREIIQIFISFFFFCPGRNLLTYTALPAQGNRENVEMLIKGPSTPFLPGGHPCELYFYMKGQVQQLFPKKFCHRLKDYIASHRRVLAKFLIGLH